MNLFIHQKRAVNLAFPVLLKYKIVYLSMEVRTGKTITALSLAEKYGAKKVLFLTKKKAINSINSDYDLLGSSYQFLCINYESMHKIEQPKSFDFIIIDEAHSFSAYPRPSQRTKKLKQIAKLKPIIYLSGTPTPESYSQIFHQLWISSFSPFSEYRNFYAWAKDYVNVYQRMINSMLINNYSRAKQAKIHEEILHLFISITQKEAGFTCLVNEHFRYLDMPPKLHRIFRDMKKDNIAFVEDHATTANNGVDLIDKLAQISGGTIILDDIPKGVILSKSKALQIKADFEGKKIAIVYRYKAELELLKKVFGNLTESPELFQLEHGLNFVGQVQSAREGLDLSKADALIIYNMDFSATTYFQIRGRLQKQNRDKTADVYYYFFNQGIGSKIYNAVQKKKNFTYSYYRNIIKVSKKAIFV